MINTKKLHVFIVLTYDQRGACRIDNVYFSEKAALARIVRLKNSINSRLDSGHLTFHIIKKTVKGSRYSFSLEKGKREFYKFTSNQ